MTYYAISEETAIRRLTNRWHEQADKYPAMRQKLPLWNYIRANLYSVRKRALLKDYEVRP
jgi:hypothetical protein